MNLLDELQELVDKWDASAEKQYFKYYNCSHELNECANELQAIIDKHKGGSDE